MALAFFDIDGTLVLGPGTERALFLELLRRGFIRPRHLAAFGAFALRHLPEYRSHIFRKDKAWLAGLPVDAVQAAARDWLGGYLPAHWNGPCVDRLRRHQAAGDRVVLLSGTPDFVAEGIREHLGADEAIGSRCGTRQGQFCAVPPLAHPFGETKLELARAAAARHGLTLDAAVAYGDSIHDLPLLAAAGRAVAVRPDRGLAAAARSSGWEILGQR